MRTVAPAALVADMHRLILPFLLFCFPGFLSAQNTVKVTGVVIDSTTHAPVADVAVRASGSAIGSYTDSRGHFRLRNLSQGSITLSFHHVRYELTRRTVTLTDAGQIRLTIRLAPKKYTTPPVTVYGEQSDPRTETISRNEIETSHATSITDILAAVPGVMAESSSGSGGTGIRIRGSQPNQVLVLVNGSAINDPVTGEADLREIPLNLIQKITVHKGGRSAEFGSGAFAGVVEITLTSPAETRARTTLGLGTYGHQSAGGKLSGAAGRWKYLISLSGKRAGNQYHYSYKRPDGTPAGATRKNAGLERYSAHSSATLHLPARTFRIQGNYIHAQRGLPGTIHQLTPFAEATRIRYGGAVDYTQQFTPGEFDAGINYTRAVSGFVNDPPNNAPLRFRTVPAYDSEYSTQALKSRTSYRNRFSPLAQWSVDITAEQSTFHQTGEPTRYSQRINAVQRSLGIGLGSNLSSPALFNQLIVRFKPQLRYSAIRVDEESDHTSYPFTSYAADLAVSWQAPVTATLHLHTGRSFRLPTFGDLFYEGFRITGNPYLQPEKGREYSAGLQFSLQRPIQSLFRIERFHRTITDRIIWETGSFGNFTPKNTDSRITGYSIRTTVHLFNNSLELQGYYEHLSPLNKGEGHNTYNKILPYIPREKWQTSVRWKGEYFSLTFHHRYRGDRYRTEANTHEVPGFHVSDLQVTGPEVPLPIFPSAELTPGFRVDNLWDNQFTIAYRMPEPGRTCFFTLTLKSNRKQQE